MIRWIQCKIVGHIDEKVVGRLDQVVCLRCGRKNPPDMTVEELKKWINENASNR